jgi:toxin ParE1/3/4
MAITILPDAQEDLLPLREYMLNNWSEADLINAENEIFDKLALLDPGLLTGAPIQELASVGINEYQNVFTTHHKLVYRRINSNIYVHTIAGHRQNYPTLLMARLLKH